MNYEKGQRKNTKLQDNKRKLKEDSIVLLNIRVM